MRRPMPMNRLHVLGEATSAIAGAGKQELKADAGIVADAAANVVDVGPEPLAQVGHLVDEADLGRQHRVGDVLGHLRAFGRHDQERLLGPQERGCTARATPPPTSGRRTPTTTRSGFMKSSIAAPSLRNSGLLATSMRPPAARRRSCDPRLVPTGTVLLTTTIASRAACGNVFQMPAMASATAQMADEIGIAASPLWRADGDEDQRAVCDRRRKVGRELQPAFAAVALDQLDRPGS